MVIAQREEVKDSVAKEDMVDRREALEDLEQADLVDSVQADKYGYFECSHLFFNRKSKFAEKERLCTQEKRRKI